jgi:putative DNA primase/helicase
MKATACPCTLANAVLAQGEWKGIPELRSVTASPFLRGDGSVCSKPGYDEATGVMLAPIGPLPVIPRAPTREDAEAAELELFSAFEEFPFKNAAAWAAFLAFMLTVITRPILPVVPLYLFTSPVRGSGKGLLLDGGALIATGATATKRSFPNDRNEIRKVMQSVASAGDSILVFDNVHSGLAVGDDTLNMYITAESIGDRTLGQSKAQRIVNSSVICLTGNNISTRSDLVRRTLAITLDPECEHPESRTFRIPNLKTHITARRGELLTALLTIVRAFVLAGAPVPERELLGGFEDWDCLVRCCVIWVSNIDPVDTQIALREDDPDAGAARAMFVALWDKFGPRNFKVAEVKALCETSDDVARARKRQDDEELKAAVADAVSDPSKLQWWFKNHRDQWRGEFQLVKVKKLGNTAVWRINKADAKTKLSRA